MYCREYVWWSLCKFVLFTGVLKTLYGMETNLLVRRAWRQPDEHEAATQNSIWNLQNHILICTIYMYLYHIVTIFICTAPFAITKEKIIIQNPLRGQFNRGYPSSRTQVKVSRPPWMFFQPVGLPSGKRLYNYGKPPFLMGISTIINCHVW